MKPINFFRFLLISTIIFVNTDCKKMAGDFSFQPINLPPSPIGSNLKASAGPDQVVFLPDDFCTIGGSVSGDTGFTVSWKKVSGPTSFHIENPSALGTKVTNLENGVYQFEITVTLNGFIDRDTCDVTVGSLPINAKEVILGNQKWGAVGPEGPLLWGSAILINNIDQFVPTGSVFKTYIKRDASTSWEELIQGDNSSWYEFVLMNGALCIWSSSEEKDTPDIKLVY